MAPALVSALITHLIVRLIHEMYLQLAIGLPIYAISLAVLVALIVGPEDLKYIAKTSGDVKYVDPLLAKALTLKPGIRRLIRTAAK